MSRPLTLAIVLAFLAACGNPGPRLSTEWGPSAGADVPPGGTDVPTPSDGQATDPGPGRDVTPTDAPSPDDVPAADVVPEVPAGDDGPGDPGPVDDGPPPACSEGDSGTAPCGLNGRGTVATVCADGAWRETGDCSDPDACVDDATTEVACGLNGRGSRKDACVAGQWLAGACSDPDACVDGGKTAEACGLNGRGTRKDECVAGQWVTGACNDPDECVDGTERLAPCGKNGSGKQRDVCQKGTWVPGRSCVLPGRWTCSQNACKAVFGDPACGNGDCSPLDGESPESCPADCGVYTTMEGDGRPCGSAWDCIFYPWKESGPGYWECQGFFSGECTPVATKQYCGTVGFDYCYLQNGGVETPSSCPQDCQKKNLNCGSALECVYLEWPKP